MKRFATLLLALIMILSLATTAFAEDGDAAINNSITINNALPGETYALYKLFDLMVNDESNPSAYSYTITEDWEAFFAPAGDGTEAGPGNKYITVNNAGYVTAISDAAALAKAAAAWTGKPDATRTVDVGENENTAVFAGLENGYWLITSTLGTFAMTETTPAATEVTIIEKNPEDTIEKQVKEDSTSAYSTWNDAQVGDEIKFWSKVTLLKGTRSVVITDTMTAGLTYNNDANILELDNGYTVTATETGFVLTFTEEYLASLEKTVTLNLHYSATLNDKAIVNDENGVAIVDQNNTIKITFGESQSVEATTTTKTYKFSIFKRATGSEEHLAGAVFSLKKDGVVVPLIKLDDNNYRIAVSGEEGAVDTFTTVASGDIVIWGVDADSDYTLEEKKAPDGYNKLTAEVNVSVARENNTQIKVENKAGTELPSTGGMGTTLFYMFGGVMVLASVVLLVTKKRMSAA